MNYLAYFFGMFLSYFPMVFLICLGLCIYGVIKKSKKMVVLAILGMIITALVLFLFYRFIAIPAIQYPKDYP